VLALRLARELQCKCPQQARQVTSVSMCETPASVAGATPWSTGCCGLDQIEHCVAQFFFFEKTLFFFSFFLFLFFSFFLFFFFFFFFIGETSNK
jgi:hypothetical protein